ncbi:SCO2322 family protein [Streptomyces sp. NBC_00513]|uniref:SCO2322 family protein n=1 Tax=unclassified Streptomyces TaxID=2593676 RepID=UPI002250D1AD|nr:SCO2322 family protein [Streptomyces sp. NBC_00424]MCX5075640.1 SCO2322 family protein [Streptomyces sp. NBC_00424]WUD41264.1 SCO2322 family protein [Streptomyces sp. NBC_00513]
MRGLPARRFPALALAFGVLLVLFASAPAMASSYRYWSFWDGGANGSWSYATQGPSTARPADGSVQGFRFGVSKDAGDQSGRPRADADFEAVCSATPAEQGRKRVALVIDFGLPAEAPSGETPPGDAPRTACARVAPDATSAEALAAVAKPLRYNSAALLCGISGYPRQGCGEPIADGAGQRPSASPSSPSSPSASSASSSGGSGGPSAGLVVGVVAVAALAAAGVWQSRRRAR